MYILNVDERFSAAHQLTTYKGPCENLHGHTWKLRLTVSGTDLDNAGMLIDFQELKKILRDIRDQFDHRFLNEVLPFSPTSENLARHIFEQVRPKLPDRVHLDAITVWESDTSFVQYHD